MMTNRIEPFRGLLYDVERCGVLSNVVAPPYDLIDRARQDALYARSRYNIVRLELNRDPDPYASAARTMGEWLREGVLRRAPRPAIYLYSQFFEVEGRRMRRDGLIVRLRLEEFSARRILPHERTFPKARQDRLDLLTALRANVSSVFGLYSGAHPEIAHLVADMLGREPLLEVTDDLGIRNQLRPIEEAEAIAMIQRELDSPRIFIADGHHRYETALEYRRRLRAAEGDPVPIRPYDYTMMTLVACDDPGLLILPTHRVVRRLDPAALARFDEAAAAFFTIERFADADAMRAARSAGGRGTLAVALGGDRLALRLLRLKSPAAMAEAMPAAPAPVRRLDVSVLHTLVLERLFGITPEQVKAGGLVDYTTDARAALDEVVQGRAAGAFLMNPPSITDVEEVSLAGAVMPEKSTYFYPKLLTGLVLNPLDDDLGAQEDGGDG
ncbi:MAG TPA: DUF1015 domain-containing protein [Candidatus Binataceae bacterium]|jgi:uncharacterized protein (DUF1015 family)|nr:DUF1015 domain-containing protein [Candidatus Binataceae bacterium]